MRNKKKKVDTVPEGFFDVDKELQWYKEAFESKRGAPKPVARDVVFRNVVKAKSFMMTSYKSRV
jgi:hypothetical protein